MFHGRWQNGLLGMCVQVLRNVAGGIKNGDLLKLAEAEFDLFITSDQNLRYQQKLMGRKIAILELSTNDWNSIQSDIDLIRTAIAEMKSSDFIQYKVG